MLLAVLAAGGCAPSSPSGGSSTAAADTTTPVAFIWSPDADCSTCHTAEANTSTDGTNGGIHLTQNGATCISCHNDEDALVSAHQGKDSSSKMPVRLKTTEVTEESCLACHGSTQALAEQTAASTVLTDKNGTVVNPHDVPQVAGHEKITCTSCHVMHTTEDLDETAMAFCVNCHHKTVFECNTCHD